MRTADRHNERTRADDCFASKRVQATACSHDGRRYYSTTAPVCSFSNSKSDCVCAVALAPQAPRGLQETYLRPQVNWQRKYIQSHWPPNELYKRSPRHRFEDHFVSPPIPTPSLVMQLEASPGSKATSAGTARPLGSDTGTPQCTDPLRSVIKGEGTNARMSRAGRRVKA